MTPDTPYKPMVPTHYADIFKQEKREHIQSVDCWCKPYPADDDEIVWIHRTEEVGNC